MGKCTLCPRMCGVDRKTHMGFCGEYDKIRISRAAPHMFEEPPISGTKGSGTVFFTGCSLRCVFCQNRDISREGKNGRTLTPNELAKVFFELQGMGVHNINLVTPTHFADGVCEALTLAKPRLFIPVVYNTSGYERVETLKKFEGLVDIYLPDYKYHSEALAEKYSNAPDYPSVALAALQEMYRQTGKFEYGRDGMLTHGVVVRHLILPSCRQDSIAALDALARELPPKDILISLMSQYTPDFAKDTSYSELHRRITTFEYNYILEHALRLGFDGFMQALTSASKSFTPNF